MGQYMGSLAMHAGSSGKKRLSGVKVLGSTTCGFAAVGTR